MRFRDLLREFDEDDVDDLIYIMRDRMGPSLRAVMDTLSNRPGWSSTYLPRPKELVFYSTVGLYPRDWGVSGSQLVAVFVQGRNGVFLDVCYRPEIVGNKRKVAQSKRFTNDNADDALALIESYERQCGGMEALRQRLRSSPDWTETHGMFYSNIDVYPEFWRAPGSKLHVEFFHDKRGRDSVEVIYRKQPFRDDQRNRNPTTKHKVFTDPEKAARWIAEMEDLCRRYKQPH